MITITIPFRLPSLNEYINKLKHDKYIGNRFKQEIDDSIIWVLKSTKQKIDKPVKVKFIWYEQTKRRDKDNVASAKKYIFDALQKAQILPNDNNKYIAGIEDDFIYKQGNKVIIEIWEEEK